MAEPPVPSRIERDLPERLDSKLRFWDGPLEPGLDPPVLPEG